jgi:hypothetical protein
MTEEDKISRRYRELLREEPPRQVDDAILAAARRAVRTRPAPLVVPSGRQRWYFPLAAAAIIVLAVGVTLHMQLQQPAEEMVSSNTMSAPAAKEAAPSTPAPETVAPSSRRALEMRDEAPARRSRPAGAPTDNFEKEKRAADGARREQNEPAPRLDLQAPPAPFELRKSQDVAATPPAAAREELARQSAAGALFSRVEPTQPQAAPSRPAPAPAAKPSPAPQPKAAAGRVQATIAEKADSAPKLAASSLQSPEQWLQGIADLRAQSYHDEADRQLAEFRKRYPDYRIAEAMLRKVERPR